MSFVMGMEDHRNVPNEEDREQRGKTFSEGKGVSKGKLKESKTVARVRNKNNRCESGQKNEYLKTAGKMERG